MARLLSADGEPHSTRLFYVLCSSFVFVNAFSLKKILASMMRVVSIFSDTHTTAALLSSKTTSAA